LPNESTNSEYQKNEIGKLPIGRNLVNNKAPY